MNQAEIKQKVDGLLWDLLSEEETTKVLQELDTNAALRTEYAHRLIEHEMMLKLRRESLFAQMEAFEAEEMHKTGEKSETKVVQMPPSVNTAPQMKVVKTRPIYWAAAAGLALLIVFGGGYFWAKSQYSDAALAAEFAAKPRIVPSEKEEPTAGTGEVRINITEYTTKGKAAFAAKEYDRAIPFFKALLEVETLESDLKHEIEWKLVCSYLATGQTTEGSPFSVLLPKIAENDRHLYQKAAQELQTKVGSFWWKIAH